ncbi:MAG: GNAT family N-acetyltransferase [Chloroflexi bacterium]|nr:GNAT family N-acetyltransferase [Chloroflexota bacterium]
MGTIQYRSCTSSDIDQVLKFWETATHGGSTNTREAILIFLELHPDLFILAWDADLLVGTVIGAWDGWRASIARLAIHEEYRRRGIARELVARAERLLISKGTRRVYANVFNDSQVAFEFWRSVGFTPNTIVEPYAKDLSP